MVNKLMWVGAGFALGYLKCSHDNHNITIFSTDKGPISTKDLLKQVWKEAKEGPAATDTTEGE